MSGNVNRAVGSGANCGVGDTDFGELGLDVRVCTDLIFLPEDTSQSAVGGSSTGGFNDDLLRRLEFDIRCSTRACFVSAPSGETGLTDGYSISPVMDNRSPIYSLVVFDLVDIESQHTAI